MSTTPPPDSVNSQFQPAVSKQTLNAEAALNTADCLEGLIQQDSFSKRGFLVFYCTYESNADWEFFIDHLYKPATGLPARYNGLDPLDSFAPTVMEDPTFAGASAAELRAHFKTGWQRALYDENPRSGAVRVRIYNQ
ncbi:hypothetical protein BDW75DRAFT_242440 [Aspergillus navahoensis]